MLRHRGIGWSYVINVQLCERVVSVQLYGDVCLQRVVCLQRALSPAAIITWYSTQHAMCVRTRLFCCAIACLTSCIFTGSSTDTAATLYLSSLSMCISLRAALYVIFGAKSTLCCAIKRCIHSAGRLPPYRDNINSLIGRSQSP